MTNDKARVLIVGTGGIGAMSAYALDQGGKAEVTAVMRSNYGAVSKNGFEINSIQYGKISGWKPANIRTTIPDVQKESLPPYDFILVTTKNTPDIPPSIASIIAPAFPSNPIISCVTYLGATQHSPGKILHDDPDIQKLGPFTNPNVPIEIGKEATKRYISVYDPHKNLDLTYDPDVKRARWRKLLYNATYNPVAAILGLDTPRMRMSEHIIDDLIRPIMLEVLAAAEACGVSGIPPDLPETVIRGDPTDTGFKPSMCQDAEAGRFMEIEYIVGEPLREGEKRGVNMPMLRTVYGILKGLQMKVKEDKGLWVPGFEKGNPYA